MTKKKKWLIAGLLLLVAIAGYIFGVVREERKYGDMVSTLLLSSSRPSATTVDFSSLSDLPPPVLRYFKHVLKDGQAGIQYATLTQKGALRQNPGTKRWSPFRARELVIPSARGFVWDVRVIGPWGLGYVRVVDAFAAGRGQARVSLLSAVCVAAESASPALNEGGLHRYLAEAVWFPTALLPQSGVQWAPIDEHNARASIQVFEATVSLDFEFNAEGEICRVYTPERWRKVIDAYVATPWEGFFSDYQKHHGMLIPMAGEVGWHVDGSYQPVWKGRIERVEMFLGTPEPVPADN